MKHPLSAVEDWAAALLERIGPQQRQRLATLLARKLRQQNQSRMRKQVAPDGSAWALRKKPTQTLRHKGNSLRETAQGPMMRKLATAKYLRATGSPNEAVVSFADRVQRIARVHHNGETDAVNFPSPPMYDYPERPLLGLGDTDLQAIQDLIFKHLQS